MQRRVGVSLLTLILVLAGLQTAPGQEAQSDEGFVSIFDGESLEGWDGNPEFWSVRDGAITGRTTPEKPTRGNTFIVWRDGEVGDFELRLQFRIDGGNSGIQYRSREVDPWVMAGYQADFDSDNNWTGTLYDERTGRGVLARRGSRVVIQEDGTKETLGPTTPEETIVDSIKAGDWNDYRIIARGNHLIHEVNGHVTIDVVDHHEGDERARGLLALQLHQGPPMTVQFKNLRLKQLDASDDQSSEQKRIVFLAGRPSHGYGAHEHYAGCRLLAESLREAYPDWQIEVVQNGWPEDSDMLRGSDCIVMYADGGGRHPVLPHLETMDALADEGTGIVCLHYAVEVPKGEPGEHFLKWIGGYFEAWWSVNPHWVAEFEQFPDHPISRGVKPFAIQDEWYYHMRFRDELRGVTPILTAVPPASTLTRPDGAHSGNPHVRRTAGQPQHVAWAAERENGGRGFGFTGGHVHWNWGEPNFRQVVLNAIAWCAHADVPENGVSARRPGLAELEANQDYPQPEQFNREQIRQRLGLPEDDGTEEASERAVDDNSAAQPVARSPIITRETPGHSASLEAPLNGARQLFLVVRDGGNGYSCDWADWIRPRLSGPAGELDLSRLEWKSASSDWGRVRVGRNAAGGRLQIDGQSYENGIGTHANSVIAFDLPEGYDTFHATVGLDVGGTSQAGCGGTASAEFLVYTDTPPAAALAGGGQERDPDAAVAALDVADGLEATLFASEPDIKSLTNLDIDARGRVWVCEVVNYRRHNGRREEGDRILILEDEDGDGISDTTKVYYQGRDVDSAMGICVLGNRVIVSCSPQVLVFTDVDGDDLPDRKEVFFSETGQPQHDHSAHSFIFGPDGKYYWNFGNTGKVVHDAEGNPVVDIFGRPVVDNGDPYYGGMAFRCNPDGSAFEVLGHNFRNNYEITVDSFGNLWQSDNDDDGNKGVRINFVMEFGNYGYLDEVSGAGWKVERTGMHPEIPFRHWHQNDPGVVPNLLQTGAGSPTGITVYEGRLLPEPFWDQVLHCDAGPNIVRAYPVTPDGAGYQAEIVNLVHGARDDWFRPADVCVAPDGSVFITDWYDPGVGGHNMGDLDRGRLFRIAPPDHAYRVPEYDFSTVDGAVAALKNPAGSVRYLAWSALQEMGPEKAGGALREMARSENPQYRARALWLLGKMPGLAAFAVQQAVQDSVPDIRNLGIRLARQTELADLEFLQTMARDSSPQVRREVAIALHGRTGDGAADVWTRLARQHEPGDRWYLEALGIGARGNWDACFSRWLDVVGEDWSSPAGREIVWRSRSSRAPALLAQLIKNPETSIEEQARYYRALDFHDGPEKEQALKDILGL